MIFPRKTAPIRLVALLLLLVIVPALALVAQSRGSGSRQSGSDDGDLPVARLVYADDILEVEILDFTGAPVEPVDFGSEILIGFAIRTGMTSVELRLEPNGSIMRLAEDTFLKFEEMQGLPNTSVNSAALINGEMRMVAARRQGQNYRITTGMVAMGVRGTDFIVRSDPETGTTVSVSEGRVELFEPESGSAETVNAGAAATADADTRQIRGIDPGVANTAKSLDTFADVSPTDVPRETGADYRNDFDYFSAINAEAYREFFESEDYFADYQEYMERFYDYYQSEMEEFEALLEREAEELQRREQEAQDTMDADEQAFEDWLESQGNW